MSVYPDDGHDAETLIKNADTAMYQAKENGRQSYRFFKPAMNVRAVERQSIEEDLRRALERDEFVLHYQPKIDLRTGEITGAEALIRWMHPTRGLLAPAQFIPIAEDSGLILPIGNWVLREACRQARAWVDAGMPVATMAVNVSAVEFGADSFLDGLFAILTETGLEPGVPRDRADRKRADEACRVRRSDPAGASGTGSPGGGRRLRHRLLEPELPSEASRSTRSRSTSRSSARSPSEDDLSIVTAVISMARSLKLRVVAEGVETAEQLAFLQARQCDEAQGYHFSKPVPANEFANLLRSGVPVPTAPPSIQPAPAALA